MLASTWQYWCPSVTTSIWPACVGDEVVGAEVVGNAVGAGVVGAAEGDAVADQHTVHPALRYRLRGPLSHAAVEPADTGTLIGPVLPLYAWPSMRRESVKKRANGPTELRKPSASTPIEHRSLGP